MQAAAGLFIMPFLTENTPMPEPLHTPILDLIDSPADLRQLPKDQLAPLAEELRATLLRWASQNSGHFAASLGAVELTIALHYIFNTPEDRLIWDVGHQAYGHKILTGRRDRLHTIRKWQGLAPFPKRDESPYDTFGVGHSSTSISAALGMALAARNTGSDRKAVAIIGDGGMTAGLAFEALNHAGDTRADLLVILNDNNMSISPNVGALSNRFAQILSGKLYTSVRETGKKALSKMPPVWEIARRAEEHIKGLIVPGVLFEEFGFNYIGPLTVTICPLCWRPFGTSNNWKAPNFSTSSPKKARATRRRRPTRSSTTPSASLLTRRSAWIPPPKRPN